MLKREIILCLIGHCHLLLGISMHNDSLPGDWTFFYFLFHLNQHKSDVSVAVICFADFTSSRKHHDVFSNCFHVIKSLKSVSISYNVFLEILEQTISLHFMCYCIFYLKLSTIKLLLNLSKNHYCSYLSQSSFIKQSCCFYLITVKVHSLKCYFLKHDKLVSTNNCLE